MTDVQLVDVSKENWREVAELRVHPSQKEFTRPTLFSIAEAQFYPDVRLKAVLGVEGQPVGLVMYGLEDGDKRYWIFRLVIDSAQQRKGYGRAVVQRVINELISVPDCVEVWLRYFPDNDVAARLYRSCGFVEVGEERGQVLARLTLG